MLEIRKRTELYYVTILKNRPFITRKSQSPKKSQSQKVDCDKMKIRVVIPNFSRVTWDSLYDLRSTRFKNQLSKSEVQLAKMESRATSQTQIQSLITSQSSILKVSEHQLNAKFRSKRDLYKYLTEMCKTLLIMCGLIFLIVRYYLPPIDCVNKDFLKQILSNQKRLLHLD